MTTASWAIGHAARLLRQGAVIACPTEAVFGLSCDPWAIHAVERLLSLKARSVEQGFILVAASREQLRPFVADTPTPWEGAIAASWPGPTTWLMPCRPEVPQWLTGGRTTIAVRVTAHPVLAALCERFGGALISTSANLSGRPPAGSRWKLHKYFHGRLDAIVPGALGSSPRPTAIRDSRTGRTLRAG